MNEKIPDLIVKLERKEKERLIRKRKKNISKKIYNRSNYSFIYFLFLYNENNIVEITTNNFDVLRGLIIEIKKYTNNNKLKGIILTNVIKNNQFGDKYTFKKVYISLSNIITCMPVVLTNGNANVSIKSKSISNVIIHGYKNLMLNEIYEKFKKIGG
ncbi:hypothetical protein, conserved [Plasmodium gonderi]|uniref:Uncharacterized protein n=1 Tax=Plasmodium gonderi TaxID=77519 RepID=A0A1Y1JID2_PLAGO|nr:hypothetical protein, conserved [Plasmodium gonderi]GAW81125.1 hypothetical protein, conserved [Plasmodium gonderi]